MYLRAWISSMQDVKEEPQLDGLERDDVHQEGILREWVGVHLHSGDISDDLQEQPAKHGAHKAPGLVPDAEQHLRDDQEGKDAQQESVAGQGGDVSEMGLGERAGCEGAELIADGGVRNALHCER